jgi:hypothetical protein
MVRDLPHRNDAVVGQGELVKRIDNLVCARSNLIACTFLLGYLAFGFGSYAAKAGEYVVEGVKGSRGLRRIVLCRPLARVFESGWAEAVAQGALARVG